jgi:lysophospholipase L1-like esterase
VVYAAIGASETVGVGSTNPSTDAWSTVFARVALPPSAVYRNYGISGATVAIALTDELPKALLAKPTLVTVWLNVNDLTSGVAPAEYGSRLTTLVRGLRRGGAARVLVANTPYLDQLPIYVACRSGKLPNGVQCPGRAAALTPEAVNAAVDAYNAVIASVVQAEGVELVDLHAQGEVPADHPGYIGADGFHPSTLGHAATAAVFAQQYLRTAGNASPSP